MKIRRETPEDYEAVYTVVQRAFASAEHADGTEQDLVTALRNGAGYIPELALVAEEDGEIVGHILFTKALVGGQTVLALAPLSVLPAHQRKGVGSALVRKDTGSPGNWATDIPWCWEAKRIIRGLAMCPRIPWAFCRPLRCPAPTSWPVKSTRHPPRRAARSNTPKNLASHSQCGVGQ